MKNTGLKTSVLALFLGATSLMGCKKGDEPTPPGGGAKEPTNTVVETDRFALGTQDDGVTPRVLAFSNNTFQVIDVMGSGDYEITEMNFPNVDNKTQGYMRRPASSGRLTVRNVKTKDVISFVDKDSTIVETIPLNAGVLGQFIGKRSKVYTP